MSTFEHTPTDTNDGPKFAGQHLIFTAYDSVSTPDRFVIEVYENTNITATGTKIGEFYLTPNTTGRVQFDLANVIEGRLSSAVNAENGGIVHAHNFTSMTAALQSSDRCMREYELKLYNYSNGTKDSTAQDTEDVGVMPGICQISDGYLSFKEQPYLMKSATAKGFLTDRGEQGEDIEMHMAPEDQGIVAIVNPDKFLTSDSDVNKFHYSVYQTGGTVTDELSVAESVFANQNYLMGISAELRRNVDQNRNRDAPYRNPGGTLQKAHHPPRLPAHQARPRATDVGQHRWGVGLPTLRRARTQNSEHRGQEIP